jgi:hypothetical protein
MLLQKNPLPMRGLLERCWLFAYQTPAEDVQPLLPPRLEPVTHQGLAFWNVVVCRVHSLRPTLLPGWLGLASWHIAYRLYVRFQPQAGDPIEGLYFVRSDCNSRCITLLGNLLTDYHFHSAAIHMREGTSTRTIQVDSPAASAYIALRPKVPVELPDYSAFASLEEASSFLKYQPAGISIRPDGSANIVHISRDEGNWQSVPVHVETAQWDFFEQQRARLELCFQVDPIKYRWNRGRIYQ